MVAGNYLLRSTLAYYCLNMVRKLRRRFRSSNADLPSIIDRYCAGITGLFFLQVGSNDGKHGDPLHELINKHPDWRGIFIEPVPYAMERLKKNYNFDERFNFEQVAIGSERGRRPFYYVSEDAKKALGDELPEWYDQLGSFDPAHIGRHLNGLLEPYRKEVYIDCVPINDLLDKYAVRTVDLIHIDTEGYDYEVLKQIDLYRYRPRLILYEHKHLSLEQAAKGERLLLEAGYELKIFPADTLAIRKCQ